MGFYYNSGAPPEPDKDGSWREVLTITLVVFQVIAKPLGLLLGAVFYIGFVFWLFSVHSLLGLSGVLLPLLVLAGFAFWEWRHPPELP